MTSVSSTATITHSGGGGGFDSLSGRITPPSPWSQVCVGTDLDSFSLSSSSEISELSHDLVTAVESTAPAPAETQSECTDSSNNGIADGVTRSAWNMPSANDSVEGTTISVMGADSRPALSESTRWVRSLSTSSYRPAFQESIFSQPAHNQVNTRSNSNFVRNRPIRRGGGGGGLNYNRLHPPSPRPIPDYAHRNNFSHRPHGGGGRPVFNNGYGGRHDHRGPRVPGPRGVSIPIQTVPPPVMGYPPPYPIPAAMVPSPPYPFKPYGAPTGYVAEMTSWYVYPSMVPLEHYRIEPLHVAPPLNNLIRDQIEFYFSETNLVKDYYLKSKMDSEGWVPITLIAGFRRVQLLTNDIQFILNSLRDSSNIEIQGYKIRRHSGIED